MLYPQSNAARAVLDLSGIWSFQLKEGDPWRNIAVPASYNDQVPESDFREYAGLSRYRTSLTVPAFWQGQRVVLRFDAVTHSARILLNGREIGSHRGGFLPFEIELTDLLRPGESGQLEVEVDNRINHSTLPIGAEGDTAFFGADNPGITAVEAGKRLRRDRGINLPAFDFFNYAGINRPVRLVATPRSWIRDIVLVPALDGTVRYQVDTVGEGSVHLDFLNAEGETVASADGAEGSVRIPNPRLWEPRPGTPYLYTARITFGADQYLQTFGIREVRVEGTRFLINGKPFFFHGPCKHEDSAFHGRRSEEHTSELQSRI